MSARRRFAAATLAVLLLASCGGLGAAPAADGGGGKPQAAAPGDATPRSAGGGTAAGSAASTPAGAAAAGPALPDPEPPDAEARAQSVVAATWNADKTRRLTMKILPLVDRRSGIAGFHSEVAGGAEALDDRLSRLGAEVSPTEVIIRLPGSVLFDFDSDALRGDAEPVLADVAAVLTAYARRPARIEGHTDSIASDAYNLDLSHRRAGSVEAWLVAHGVAAGRLTTVGYGESQPVADNATAAGRQRNRRVEIVIGAEGG